MREQSAGVCAYRMFVYLWAWSCHISSSEKLHLQSKQHEKLTLMSLLSSNESKRRVAKFKRSHSRTIDDGSLTGGTVKCCFCSVNRRGYPEPFSQQEDKHCKPSRRTAWSKRDDCVCVYVCMCVYMWV